MKAAVIAMGKKAARLGADIRLNTPVTAELIEEIKPHTVFNAIGATPIIPNILGKDQKFVVNSHDVLNGLATPEGNVVVIGGGLVGLEVCEYLAEKDAKITVLEMMKECGADLGMARKICVQESLYMSGVVHRQKSQ